MIFVLKWTHIHTLNNIQVYSFQLKNIEDILLLHQVNLNPTQRIKTQSEIKTFKDKRTRNGNKKVSTRSDPI